MSTSNNKLDTEKEQLQDALIALKIETNALQSELERVRAAQFDLLRKYNHNLKNPLGNVFSFSEIMLESIDAFSKEKTIKYLNVLKEASGFGIDLINSFTAYNSFLKPQFVLNLSHTHYASFLQTTISEYKAVHPEAEERIKFQPLQSDLTLSLDPVLLKEALFQIISNAIRFSEEGSLVEIENEISSEGIKTTISDSGIGIPKEHLSKLTSPFFVGSTYDLYQKKCIGLGLAITDCIISLQQGTLHIASNNSTGTKVSIGLTK